MPKPILKKATWLLLATVCLAAVIINSCKKDSRTDQQNSVTDPVIAQAKSWYESTFPAGNKLSTQAVSGDKDLNQVISPDWQHGDTYTKLSAAVIEMPLDPAHTLASVLKDPAKNISYNNKNNSRSSFLVLKDSSGYHACIMTLIGDPAYLGNDPGKLAKSTYRKYDPAFSGLVLYFTPQGKYLNGYKYQNGHLIIPAQKQDSQSKLKVNEATALFSCTDYYVDTYVNDQVVGTHYAYTECIPVNLGGGGGGSPGGGGTAPGSNPGTGGSNPGTTTTPVPPITDPCAPKGGQPVVESAGKPSVQQVNPDPSVPVNPDGSFPPPANTPPCNTLRPTTPVTVSNNVTDPCLKKMVDAAIRSNITFSLNESMLSIFNSNTDFNLNFVDNVATNLKDPAENAETTGSAQTQVSGNRTIISSMDLQITFNKTVLSNASKEFVTATIMHEALHAYLRYSQTIVNQHLDMARNYISVMANQLVKLYPNLSPSDAQNLAWGGLEKDAGSLYTDLSQADKNAIQITNQNYQSGKSGTPCP